jgi:GNAT superfamily N-acetyltransferase
MESDLQIRTLPGDAGLREFVAAPWKILDVSAYPQWIPALRISVRSTLDPKTNPFFRKSDRALFLAEDGGRVVGRIAAIYNASLAEVGRDPGFVGFFECVDRQDVAAALLGAAEEWLRARGCSRVQGPWSPSSNYEGGVLIRGFEHPQTFFTPWNPEYYAGLLEGAGYVKAKDLMAWHVRIASMRRRFEEYESLSNVIRARAGLTLERVEVRNFERVMRDCWVVYQECWKDNWGFCPLPVEEWEYLAHELKPLIVPEGSLLVKAAGETIGFAVSLPDYNRAIMKDRSGRLFPLNWLRILRGRRRCEWARTLLAGVLPRFRRKGVLSVMLYESLKNAALFGTEHVEASWILEDNVEMNAVLTQLEADPYRTWRVFERAI